MEIPVNSQKQNNHFPSSMKDWLIIFLSVLIFMMTLPFAMKFYIIALPILVIGYILYFLMNVQSIGNSTDSENKFIHPFFKMVNQTFLFGVKKYLQNILYAFIAINILIIGGVFAYQYFSKEAKTKNQLAEIQIAVERYKNQTGIYPATLMELIGQNPIKREWLKDKWGTTINYELSEAGYFIYSNGKDGLKGSEDDLKIISTFK